MTPFSRLLGQCSPWLFALLASACTVHEHDLTPYGKDAQGNNGPAADPDADVPGVDAAIDDAPHPSTDPIDDTMRDGPTTDSDLTCIADCPPAQCGTISNNCGATLACGPCELSTTFAEVAGVTLMTPRYAAASVRIGNYLYIIGGLNNGTYLSTIERATIDANGNLSNFRDAGVSLVLGRSGHSAFFVNQQLYVIGGASIAYTQTVERAIVDGIGNLGPFTTVSGVTLATARGAHGSAVIGHNEYIIGGNGDTALDSVEGATFSSNGELSTFTAVSGITLSTKRFGFGSVSVGQWLYLLGGATDVATEAGSTFGDLTSIERASFDAAGLTGTFAALPSVSLAVPRYKHAAFAFGPNLYAVGGTNDVAGALATVEQATINTAGDITGPFTVSSTLALSNPRVGAVFSVAAPWFYAIGGLDNLGYLNTVERAGIQ